MKNALTFGPNPIENDFEIYKGKPVKIGISPSGSAIGIVEGYSLEYLLLKPSLINHATYRPDGTLVNNVVIEDKLPQKVKRTNISHIEPLTEGYMEALAQNLNYNSHPPKIIFPQKIK